MSTQIQISPEAREAATKATKHLGMYDPVNHPVETRNVIQPIAEFCDVAINSATEKLTKENKDWIDRCYGAETKNEKLTKELAEVKSHVATGADPLLEQNALVEENKRLREEVHRLSSFAVADDLEQQLSPSPPNFCR